MNNPSGVITSIQTDLDSDEWKSLEKYPPPVTVVRSDKFGIVGVHNTNGNIPLDTNVL